MSYFGIPIRNGASVGLGSIISLLSGSRSAPTLSLNFLSGSLDSRITFTRASTGTYFDSAGVLQTAAINAPRFDYDPSTLAAQGLLIEEARTNLLTYSEDFSNAAWAKTDITVTADNTTAPNGTATADLLTEGVAGTAFITRVTSSLVAAGSTVSAAIYVKRSSVVQWIRVRVANTTATNGGNVWFNIQTGALGNQTNIGAGTATKGTITAVGNSWYRITATTTLAVGDITASIGFTSASANGSTTRVNSSAYWVWGAQLEAGSFATSYIPTTAAAATRAQDFASVNTLTPWYNATQGTLLAVATPYSPITNSVNQILASLDDGTSLERSRVARVATSGFVIGAVTAANVVVYNASVDIVWGAATAGKTILAYKDADNKVGFNGVLNTAGTSAAGVPTVTKLTIGAGFNSLSPWNGAISFITYYPSRLSDAELQALTV
jgi:hypothetical protein